MKLSVKFTPKTNKNGILAEAALQFLSGSGPLEGFEIVGIALWRSKDDSKPPYVTFPSRTYEKDGAKKYFDYIRLQDDPVIPKSQKWALSNFIVAEWKRFNGQGEGEGF